MKKAFFTLLSAVFALSMQAQLVNQGASIIVENGASLIVETDVTNMSGSTIDIQGTGTVEVQGNLTNAGSLTMGDNAKLIFSGSDASTMTSNGAIITNLEMDKSSQNVSILDALTISQELNFVADDNKVVLGANNLTFTNSAVITSADDNEFIVADDAGTVIKEMDAADMFNYEIGTASGDYTPLNADVTGATFPLSLAVNTESVAQPNLPVEVTDNINRFWNVDAANDNNLNANLTGTYVDTDIETGSDATLISGASYNGSAWSYAGSIAGTNTVTGSLTENGDFTGSNRFGTISLMAFLDGAYSGGSMSTTLNSMGLLPTTSPYGGGEIVDASIFTSNPDIVDWISLESRDGVTAAVEGTGVGFIKSDGSIVSLSGSGNPLLKNAEEDGYVIINHRNHLPVSTGSTVVLDGSAPLQDFTSTSYSAFGSNGLRSNGGAMTMWAGDANQDNTITYVGAFTDITPISTDVFLNPANTTFQASVPFAGYNISDTNMDGQTIYVGALTDITPISTSVLLNTANTTFQASTVVSAQMPE